MTRPHHCRLPQGDDLGARIQTQRHGWEELLPAQAWMLERMLHLSPGGGLGAAASAPYTGGQVGGEHPGGEADPRPQGSLQAVPRKAVIQLTEPDGSQTTVKVGMFIDNCGRRADKLEPERRAEPDVLGTCW
ncbi:hypothetical protein [Streptomyces sp. NPDC020983]|uniref:hypothetical protein n=1 Tax=Streptomyces sp. NPDC020983 TaxID=3365106 RepID=UPI0037910E7E